MQYESIKVLICDPRFKSNLHGFAEQIHFFAIPLYDSRNLSNYTQIFEKDLIFEEKFYISAERI